jgi:hypothetical protein
MTIFRMVSQTKRMWAGVVGDKASQVKPLKFALMNRKGPNVADAL